MTLRNWGVRCCCCQRCSPLRLLSLVLYVNLPPTIKSRAQILFRCVPQRVEQQWLYVGSQLRFAMLLLSALLLRLMSSALYSFITTIFLVFYWDCFCLAVDIFLRIVCVTFMCCSTQNSLTYPAVESWLQARYRRLKPLSQVQVHLPRHVWTGTGVNSQRTHCCIVPGKGHSPAERQHSSFTSVCVIWSPIKP